jgi:hypothetical protein
MHLRGLFCIRISPRTARAFIHVEPNEPLRKSVSAGEPRRAEFLSGKGAYQSKVNAMQLVEKYRFY